MRKVGNLYECEVCGLLYRDKEWAAKCEAWCREHGSCSLEITKYAVQKSGLFLS